MVSKLFMGYALAPDRPGSVFLVPGGALNTNFPSSGFLDSISSKNRATPLTIGGVLRKKFWPGRLFGTKGPPSLGFSATSGSCTPYGKWEPRADPELATRYSTVA